MSVAHKRARMCGGEKQEGEGIGREKVETENHDVNDHDGRSDAERRDTKGETTGDDGEGERLARSTIHVTTRCTHTLKF